jgi:acyl dehydratase
MGVTVANIEVGTQLAPLVKHMTLEKMVWFSGGDGRREKVNLHTDAAAAERDTGMKQPFASGRISLGYASELMSRFVGLDLFSHAGTIDFKFIKPVMPGDTITVHGRVSEVKPVDDGTLVVVDIYCVNQKGEKTSVGSGSAVMPDDGSELTVQT